MKSCEKPVKSIYEIFETVRQTRVLIISLGEYLSKKNIKLFAIKKKEIKNRLSHIH